MSGSMAVDPSRQLVCVAAGPTTVVVTAVVTVTISVSVTVGVVSVTVAVLVCVAVTVVVEGAGPAGVLDPAGGAVSAVPVSGAVVVAVMGALVNGELVGGAVGGVVPVTDEESGNAINAAAGIPSMIPTVTSTEIGWRYQGLGPRASSVSKLGTNAGVASARARISRWNTDMSGVTGIGRREKAGVASASVWIRVVSSGGWTIPVVGMIYCPHRGSGRGERCSGGCGVPGAGHHQFGPVGGSGSERRVGPGAGDHAGPRYVGGAGVSTARGGDAGSGIPVCEVLFSA